MKRGITALSLVVTFALPGALLGAVPAAAQEPSSAVTKPGTGAFANLNVTVAQTADLIDQVVRVSWAGGPPTKFVAGQVVSNFLEIMQCWGDETGPDRTQCENLEGASTIDQRAPGELPPAPESDPLRPNSRHLPFRQVGAPEPTTLAVGTGNPFFDSQITNEVHRAIIRADGTGEVNFEMQSAAQSAGLGCGRPDTATGAVEPCWLVVMPVNDQLADGSPRPEFTPLSSGLDPRRWKDRIEFRLDFAPLAATCAFGVERSITGHEMVTDAVSRWQRVLCLEGQNPFSFTRTTDQLVRAQATSTDPDLGIVNEPVPPDQAPAGRPLVYAPVAVNALTIAFNLDAQPNLALLPEGDPRRDLGGTPITEITLNARLVAKLLTQSYLKTLAGDGRAVPAGNPLVPAREARLQENPQSLFADPEFFELNPDLTDLLSGDHTNPLVQVGTSDLTGLLWDWVLADPDARAWIDGATDAGAGGAAAERTMVINPANRGLRSPVDAYPRNDLLCSPVSPPPNVDVRTTICPLDRWPSTDDIGAAGRNAARGDSLQRTDAVDVTALQNNKVIRLLPVGRQPADQQQVMAVIDAATAERYRLPTVRLVNAAGRAVAPDEAGLTAAVDAMRASGTEGVLVPDPASGNPAAYPLTAVSYAVTAPTALEDTQAAADYARFLRYAAGPGQTPGERPGQLPPGYLPLPQAMRDQTLAAADTIVRLAAEQPAQQPGPPAAGATGQGSGGTPGGGAGLLPGPTPGVAAPGPTAGAGTGAADSAGIDDAAIAAAEPAAPAEPAVPAVARAAQPTAAVTMPGNVGAVLVALFVVGGLAAVCAPATQLLARGPNRSPSGGT